MNDTTYVLGRGGGKAKAYTAACASFLSLPMPPNYMKQFISIKKGGRVRCERELAEAMAGLLQNKIHRRARRQRTDRV